VILKVVAQNVVAGIVEVLVVLDEVAFEPTEQGESREMASEAVAVAGHRVVGNDDFVRALARDGPAFKNDSVQRREPDILVVESHIGWVSQNRRAEAVSEKLS
jgi:hypothetical protein